MGGKSGGDQVTGYQYNANLVVMIGNRIEELKAINFDKRGWQINDEQIADPRAKMLSDATYNFTQPGIYGKDEGGVAGSLGLRIGNASPVADNKYAEYLQSKEFPSLSYPYLSYLVFKGRKPAAVSSLIKSSSPISESGFYFGNNPFLKEMMLWVKRIHVRNDGRAQWYDPKAEIGIMKTASSGSERLKTGFINFNRTTIEKYSTNPINISEGVGQYSGASDGKTADMQYFGTLAVGWSSYNKDEEDIYGAESHTSFEIYGFDLIGIATSTYVVKYKAKTISTKWQVTSPAALLSNQLISTEIDSDGFTVETYSIVIDLSKCTKIKFEIRFSGGVFYTNDLNTIFAASYVKFKVHPSFSWTSPVDGEDINPIHKIREILTDDTAMNISEFELNDDNFVRAADQIFDEGLGISAVFAEKNCKEALDEICAHIEAGVRVNRQTGKYEVILFRDNWQDSQSPLHFDKTNIKRGSFSVEVMNTDDAINVLNVNYYDRANIKNSSFNVYENGLIQTMGRENAETADFPYFMNQRNAEVVANWKLKQLSTPAWKGSFATSARAARKLNRYDVVKVTWPSKQIYDMPVRVMKINLGTATDTSVTIDFVEVVSYSSDLSSSIIVDAPVSGILPPQPASPIAFEVPYYALVRLLGQREADAQLEYNPELGYLGVAAEKPQNNSLNALLYTDGGTGDYLQFQKVGVVDYSSGVYLDQQISQLDTSFTVIDLGYVQNGAPKFSGVAVGTIGQLNSELISFVSYDLATKILTVKRGVLDTLPTKHISGNIHFWGESFSYDSIEYSMGETVGAQVLTTTPSGVDLLNPGAIKTVAMNARAIRPYPPANVKINGEYWPEDIETDLVLTWVDRNRLQQTGGEILDWYDGGVTIEPNTQTHLILSQLDENNLELATSNANVTGATSYAMPISAMQANTRFVKIILKTIRNGYESYQAFEHTVELSQFFSAPYDLTVEFKND